jgi:3-hydroxyacyl-CoA dehydrogenase
MFYADQVGLSEVARALRAIAAGSGGEGSPFAPAPLLARLAQDGGSFSDYKGRPS